MFGAMEISVQREFGLKGFNCTLLAYNRALIFTYSIHKTRAV